MSFSFLEVIKSRKVQAVGFGLQTLESRSHFAWEKGYADGELVCIL